jgi:hypothetical protein
MKKKHTCAVAVISIVLIACYVAGYYRYTDRLSRLRRENFGSLNMMDVREINSLSEFYPFVNTGNVELIAECYLVASKTDNMDQIDQLLERVNSNCGNLSIPQYRDIVRMLYTIDAGKRVPGIVRSICKYLRVIQGSRLVAEDVGPLGEILVFGTINAFPYNPNGLLTEGEAEAVLFASKDCAREFLPKETTKYFWKYVGFISKNGIIYSDKAVAELSIGEKYIGEDSKNDFNLVSLFGFTYLKNGVKDKNIKQIEIGIVKFEAALAMQTTLGGALYARGNLLRAKVERAIVLGEEDGVNKLLCDIDGLLVEYEKNQINLGGGYDVVYEVHMLRAEVMMFLGDQSDAIVSYNKAVLIIQRCMGKDCPLVREINDIINGIKGGIESEVVL